MNSSNTQAICLFILLSFTGFSQGDQRARALLDEVSAVYASYETIHMHFSYQLDNTTEGISQREVGEIRVAKDKYHLTILGIQQIFDGTFVYTIDDLNEEVIIQEQTALDTPLNPLHIFDFHKEGYLLQWDIEQRVNGRDIRYVKLIPTDPESQSKYLLLGIDINSKHLYKMIDLGISGTDTTLVVEKFTSNISIAPETFQFDKVKYADYYIDNY
jgi:outer membrane lipoprotein-sorting protein